MSLFALFLLVLLTINLLIALGLGPDTHRQATQHGDYRC